MLLVIFLATYDDTYLFVTGQTTTMTTNKTRSFQEMLDYAQNLIRKAQALKESSKTTRDDNNDARTMLLEEAKTTFWGSIQIYDGSSVQNLQQAMQGFLGCFALEGDVAMGYVSIAEVMFAQRDANGAKNYLVQALTINPEHGPGLSLARKMGFLDAADVILDKQGAQNRVFRKADDDDRKRKKTLPKRTDLPLEACSNANDCAKVVVVDVPNDDTKLLLNNGWDDNAHQLYQAQISEMNSLVPPNMQVSFSRRRASDAQKYAVHDIAVSKLAWWKNRINQGSWETETYDVFDQYITADTTVVDFGAWIGPTVLYHAQFAKRVFAIEADPHAYASLERNLALNSDQAWSHKVSPASVCVSTPNDVGLMTMKSAEAGNSCSSLGDNVEWACGAVKQEWQVQCYTLPYLFAKWGVTIGGPQSSPVFIKIDIESYECALVPSFYDWLVGETFLPTIFVSFHPQITLCDEEQLHGVLKVFKLFQHVSCDAGKRPLKLSSSTTFKQFQDKLIANSCFQSQQFSDFLLQGRANDPSWLKELL